VPLTHFEDVHEDVHEHEYEDAHAHENEDQDAHAYEYQIVRAAAGFRDRP
jgi:hypothetical protein